jgi:hypothetical protein
MENSIIDPSVEDGSKKTILRKRAENALSQRIKQGNPDLSEDIEFELEIPNRKEGRKILSTLRRATPNAFKLTESLRHSGYNNYDAIEDILDNSFDAGAKNVNVQVIATPGPKGGAGKMDYDSSIDVMDDGAGMDEEILQESLTYGSDTEHDARYDKGIFGLGLKTAGTSIGRKIKVLTKIREGKLLCGILDLDVVAEANDFMIEIRDPSDEESKKFENWMNKCSSPSGTIVSIEKIDRIKNQDPKQFASILAGPTNLGRTFRFLVDSKNISVNSKPIEPHDPLYWDDATTDQYTDGWKKMLIRQTCGNSGYLYYRIAQRHNTQAGKIEGKQRNQGCVIVRSMREIAQINPQGLWRPSNETYGLFIEFKWQGTWLDEDFGIEFKKSDISFSDSLKDRLIDKIGPLINAIIKQNAKRKIDESKVNNDVKNILNKRAEQNKELITVLDSPKRDRRKVAFVANNPSSGNNKNNKSNKRANGGTIKRIVDDWDFNYSLVPLGKLGQMYNPIYDHAEGVFIIHLNEDHPFVKSFVNTENEETRDAILNVLDALVMARGKMNDPDKQDVMDEVENSLSQNLRVFHTHKVSRK